MVIIILSLSDLCSAVKKILKELWYINFTPKSSSFRVVVMTFYVTFYVLHTKLGKDWPSSSEEDVIALRTTRDEEPS